MLEIWVWLFPVVFMLHDFEEVILFEPWLRRHGAEIRARVGRRAPGVVARGVEAALGMSTAAFALSVCLIFCLVALATLLAGAFGQYGMFVFAVAVFFLHGWMHVGQALLLRRYVPALATTLLLVLPYGGLVIGELLHSGRVTLPWLLAELLVGGVLAVPLIVLMRKAGSGLYRRMLRGLVG